MVIGCPNSDTYPVSCRVPARTVTWIPPTATDNSGGIPAVSSTHQPGDSFPVGSTPVTYTFIDAAGNQAQCMFTVNVVAMDTIAPVISGCPQSSTYNVPLGTSSRIATWIEPTATDDCGTTPSVFQTHRPGQSFSVGVTQVMYIFSDGAGNDAFCAFTITGKYCCYH